LSKPKWPYLYAYRKQGKKLKKIYVGKNLEDFGLKIVKEIKIKPSQLIKLKFIQQEASKGNILAVAFTPLDLKKNPAAAEICLLNRQRTYF